MNHLSLFSGIGGLDLAAERAGFRTVAFVERDKYCQRVLARHWPGVPIYDDVCKVTADASYLRQHARGSGEPLQGFGASREAWELGRVDVISGGFPCQPHSVAGKRGASGDDRDLWPEVARIVGEFRPRWFVGENVPGLLSSESGRFFGRVVGDLVSLGYRVGWGVWGANDVGALHRRDRVFIVAYAGHAEQSGRNESAEGQQPGDGRQTWRELAPCGDVAHSDATRLQGGQGAGDIGGGGEKRNEQPAGRGSGDSGRRAESRLGRMADGFPDWSHEPGDIPRVAKGVKDRVSRLRALGNAVVPAQAYPLFRAIADIEGMP
jgi:DNA (cytosine-5)-methyltransferase 1